jgi:hypothetical protein
MSMWVPTMSEGKFFESMGMGKFFISNDYISVNGIALAYPYSTVNVLTYHCTR